MSSRQEGLRQKTRSKLIIIEGRQAATMRSDRSSTMMYRDDERSLAGDYDESATRTTTDHYCRGGNVRSIRSSSSSSRKTSPSTLLVLLQLLIGMIAGQSTTSNNEETTVCVCSPRQFYFKLNLSASCPPLPPPFPPNDVFGSGVKDYTCSIGPEPVQNDAGDILLDGEELEEPTGDEIENETTNATTTTNSNDSTSTSKRRRLSQQRSMQESSSGIGKTYNSTASDYFPEVDVQWSSANFTTSALTTEVDVTPVVIYSIQFLEVDTSFNVINQDSAYVRGIDFVSGDVFNYTSVSATRRGVVPGGMNMVLRGVNAAGDPVRNVFTITYTNECGVPTFQEGDAIGWVVFVSSVLQLSDIECSLFCRQIVFQCILYIRTQSFLLTCLSYVPRRTLSPPPKKHVASSPQHPAPAALPKKLPHHPSLHLRHLHPKYPPPMILYSPACPTRTSTEAKVPRPPSLAKNTVGVRVASPTIRVPRVVMGGNIHQVMRMVMIAHGPNRTAHYFVIRC
jgi:hypothetical protein